MEDKKAENNPTSNRTNMSYDRASEDYNDINNIIVYCPSGKHIFLQDKNIPGKKRIYIIVHPMNQLHWLQIHNPLALLFIFFSCFLFTIPSLRLFFSVGTLLKKDSPVEFVDHILNRRPQSSRLGDVYRLADHQATMYNKNKHHRVEFKERVFRRKSQR